MVEAVDDVSLEFEKGKIYSLVGESGSGKSTFGLALSRLLVENQVVYSGRIDFDGVDLLSLKEREMVRYRGTGISTIFQEPMTSLDPVYRIGEQIAESLSVREKRLVVHDSRGHSYGSSDARNNAANRMIGRMSSNSRSDKRRAYTKFQSETIDLLKKVGIASPEKVAEMYPHELSGGMKQRAMIAMVLAEKPAFIVADEPTTALDVTTQIQVLALVKDIVSHIDTSVLLITHDLGVVAAVADNVAVMYGGKLVEESKVKDLLVAPLHPYTEGLIGSFPKGDKLRNSLVSIPGIVPTIGHFPSGCRFRPRCGKAFQMCVNSPALYEKGGEHKVRCFLWGNEIEK